MNEFQGKLSAEERSKLRGDALDDLPPGANETQR